VTRYLLGIDDFSNHVRHPPGEAVDRGNDLLHAAQASVLGGDAGDSRYG